MIDTSNFSYVDPTWAKKAYNRIAKFLAKNTEFFPAADMERVLGNDQPLDKRDYGVVVRALVKDGLMQPSGEVRQAPTGNYYRPVYRSTVSA